MLAAVFIIFLALWILGVATSCMFGGFIHILLALAVVTGLIRFIQEPRGWLPRRGGTHMKSLSLLGILLVVLGALALAYQGINYTHREKVVDVGPIHATRIAQERMPLPPILGGLALLGGVALLVVGARQRV